MKLKPVRKVNFENGFKTGIFFSDKLNKEVMYESGIELKFIQLIENISEVIFYVEQPFRIPLFFNGEKRIYNTPDFYIVLEDGTGVIVEIKSNFELANYQNLRKWVYLHKYCKDKGLGYLITSIRYSIQEAASVELNKDLVNKVKKIISIKGKMDWWKYSYIKDQYNINLKEFISLIIQNQFAYYTNPFNLEESRIRWPIEWYTNNSLEELNELKTSNSIFSQAKIGGKWKSWSAEEEKL